MQWPAEDLNQTEPERQTEPGSKRKSCQAEIFLDPKKMRASRAGESRLDEQADEVPQRAEQQGSEGKSGCDAKMTSGNSQDEVDPEKRTEDDKV